MKSTYSIQRKENYLIIHLSGEYDKHDFLSYPPLIVKECDKEKIYKVLVNAVDLQNTDAPTMDRFFLGEAIANTIGSKIKIAVVWPLKDINKFGENVAVNRGSKVNVVGNVADAEKWLLENKH